MAYNTKLLLLKSIVAENFCDFDTFCGNVLEADGKEKFRQKLSKCNSREDLESLVNEYI
jgi:hypothetical protein